ncbi:MAG: hypothetical protein GY928_06620, partial [Colwellia sp.]|nr:hypothetical protein [Colwellia sp.]
QTKMLDFVENAVMTGKIPMSRIDEAYGRLKALKEKYKLAERLPVDVEAAVKEVGCEANRAVEMDAARAAVNLVYDKKKSVPVKAGSTLAVVRLAKENVQQIMDIAEGIGPNYANAYNDFVAELKTLGYKVNEFKYGEKVPQGTIIAVSENYPLPGKSLDLKVQRDRLKDIKSKTKKSVINVALKDPYDAEQVKPFTDAYITAIGSNRPNAKAAAELLTGKIKTTGKLPVTPIK